MSHYTGMTAPGHFPLLESAYIAPSARRWRLLCGSLIFEGVGEPKPVPPGHVRVDGGGWPLDIPKKDFEQARGVQGEGWAYQ